MTRRKKQFALDATVGASVTAGTLALGVGIGMFARFIWDKFRKTPQISGETYFTGEDPIIEAAKRL